MAKDKVVEWRKEQLRKAGYTEMDALWLATDRKVDLHKACELAQICPHKLAVQILT